MSPVTTKCVPMEKADWLLAVSVYILYVCVCMHMWGWLTIIISCCVFRRGCIQCACLPVCAHAEHLTHWWQVLRAEKVCVCVCIFLQSTVCHLFLFTLFTFSREVASLSLQCAHLFDGSAPEAIAAAKYHTQWMHSVCFSLSSQKTCYHAFSV